ncbi:unnamed protein product [Prorocentrum cordatum]|uniref:C2H2-type domain-containing protein n=1 Tax=Prorocentrum cordatum TaxID=2364126 RepID=A0ABN9V6L7_9DINO|nr:unnamed protein product [Polarella glacialis]
MSTAAIQETSPSQPGLLVFAVASVFAALFAKRAAFMIGMGARAQLRATMGAAVCVAVGLREAMGAPLSLDVVVDSLPRTRRVGLVRDAALWERENLVAVERWLRMQKSFVWVYELGGMSDLMGGAPLTRWVFGEGAGVSLGALAWMVKGHVFRVSRGRGALAVSALRGDAVDAPWTRREWQRSVRRDVTVETTWNWWRFSGRGPGQLQVRLGEPNFDALLGATLEQIEGDWRSPPILAGAIAEVFYEGGQEDAHEFLMELLDPDRAEQTAAPFLFVNASVIKCGGERCDGRKTVKNARPQTCLQVPVLTEAGVAITTTQRAINEAYSESELEASYLWRCPRACGHGRARKLAVMSAAPEVLWLQLKRWTWDVATRREVLVGVGDAMRRRAAALEMARCKVLYLRCSDGAGCAADCTASAIGSAVCGDGALVGEKGQVKAPEDSVGDEVPEADAMQRAFYNVRVDETSRDPRRAREILVAAAAVGVRRHPTVPADPNDPAQPWSQALAEDMAVELPAVHCAFVGCTWQSDAADDMCGHVREVHGAVVLPIAELIHPADEDEDIRITAAQLTQSGIQKVRAADVERDNSDADGARPEAQLTAGGQEDAHEFLMELLDPDRAEQTAAPFLFVNASVIKCGGERCDGRKTVKNARPQTCLQVPVLTEAGVAITTTQRAINEAYSESELEASYLWRCPRACGHGRARKLAVMSAAPEVLWLQLKRWTWDVATRREVLVGVGDAMRRRAAALEMARCKVLYLRCSDGAGCAADCTASAIGSAVCGDGALVGEKGQVKAPEDSVGDEVPEADAMQRAFYNVRVDETSKDPRRAREILVAAAAVGVRRHPTVPADPNDPAQPWSQALAEDMAVELPAVHCAFVGCTWQSDAADDMCGHVREVHGAVVLPIAELIHPADEDEDIRITAGSTNVAVSGASPSEGAHPRASLQAPRHGPPPPGPAAGGAGALELHRPNDTVILRCVPRELSRDALVELLGTAGLAGRFNFVYMPMDFTLQQCIGYALVGLESRADGDLLIERLPEFEPAWSAPPATLEEHIERYRNSPVMHPKMPDAYKPAVFAGGHRVAFPEPTRPIRAPRIRHMKPPPREAWRVAPH